MFKSFKKKPTDIIQVDNSNLSEINPVGTGVTTEVLIRYSYEWKEEFCISDIDKISTPLIETSRPFCKYLLTADKMYTRSDIERMSARLGYSVWDRCGGDDCRHRWVSNIVTRR